MSKNWPMHDDGSPKKVREMSNEERKTIARDNFEKEFGNIPENYLNDFDAAFNRIFNQGE